MEASSARLDYDRRGLDETVRSSVHYYNDDAEIDRWSTPSEELEHRERDDRPPSVVSHAKTFTDARGRVDRHY